MKNERIRRTRTKEVKAAAVRTRIEWEEEKICHIKYYSFVLGFTNSTSGVTTNHHGLPLCHEASPITNARESTVAYPTSEDVSQYGRRNAR